MTRCEFSLELFEAQKIKQNFINILIISFRDPKPLKVKALHFLQTSRKTRSHCVMSQKTSIHDTRSGDLSSRILLLFIALEYCTSWPKPLEVPRHLTPAPSSPYNLQPWYCWQGYSRLLLTICVPNCLYLNWSHAPFTVYTSNCPRFGPCLWNHLTL